MKNALIAAASLAAIAAVVPAAAQAQEGAAATGVYANLNLGYAKGGGADLGILQGRVGYRVNKWVGVEGELATGVKGDTDTIANIDVKAKLRSDVAAYVVGFVPVADNIDLLARVGYGSTKIKVSGAGVSVSASEESWNYGVGAQYSFDGVNGVRADFTHQDYNHDNGHANVWTVGYTRKF